MIKKALLTILILIIVLLIVPMPNGETLGNKIISSFSTESDVVKTVK